MSKETEQQTPVTHFGIHLMVDGYQGDQILLGDKALLEKLLYTISRTLGVHIISGPHIKEVGPNNKKDPGGVSGFIMFAESHISMHTFPKRGFLSADIYTCQDTLDTPLLTEQLKSGYELQDIDVTTLTRGARYPSYNIYD